MAKEKKNNEVLEDYETKPVAEKDRMRWFSQGMVWAGSAFCLPAFSIGGMLAASLSFGSFLSSVLIGAAVLTVIACLLGIIGARTHLASAFSSRFTFGIGGAKIFGLIIAVSLFGWFGYQCSYFASSTVTTLQLFGLSGGSMTVWTIVGGLAMMITAVIGFKGIKWLSNIGVPLLFALVFIAAIITLVKVPGSVMKETAAAAAAAPTMTVPAAITTVIGAFISGACMIPDFSRFSERDSDAVFGCILGFLISFPLIILLGGLFYYGYMTADLSEIFIVQCGLGVFAALVIIVATWTTNDNNLYSSVLGITNALGSKAKISRPVLTIIVGVVSTALGALGLINYFTSFLSLLGVLIPPAAAAIVADYWIYNRKSGVYDYSYVSRLPVWRLNTCLSAVIGMIIGLLCNYTTLLNALSAVIPSSVMAMLATVIALVIINLITKKGTVVKE